MLENIKDIIIQGGCFEKETTLKNILDQRINIVYGRNGSGKSTIARALQEYSKTESDGSEKAFEAIRFNENISEQDKSKIKIFNETFIRETVRMGNDCISPIVMVGKQIKAADTINTLKNDIHDLNTTIEQNETKIVSYQQTAKDQFKKLKKLLSADDKSWAFVDSLIKGNKKNSSVTESTIDMLRDSNIDGEITAENYDSQKEAFNRDLDLLQKTSNQEEIYTKIPVCRGFDAKALYDLLNQKVEKPELTDRDNEILNILENDTSSFVRSKELFLDRTVQICPVCFQSVTSEQRENIRNVITRVLDKKAENYKMDLNRFCNETLIEYSFNEDPKLSSNFAKEYTELQLAVRSYNEKVKKYRGNVTDRLNHLFQESSFPLAEFNFDEISNRLNQAICALNTKVEEYNQTIRERKTKAKELEKWNNRLCAYNFREDILIYDRAKSESASLAHETEDLKAQLIKKESQLNKTQDEQISSAKDFINNGLNFIYCSEDKLTLKEDKDTNGINFYRLYSHGKEIQPGMASTGEKNMIALCYYFASAFEREEEKTMYKTEKLYVIDDPVSSFDQENRAGILAYLEDQMKSILRGNEHSKILLLSHDLTTVNELIRIKRDLLQAEEKPQKDERFQPANFHELKKFTLCEPYNNCTYNEYWQIFDKIFQFASSKDPEEHPYLDSIGNTMRRLLEAYFTFNYQTGFVNAMKRENILEQLPQQNRSFYRRLLNNSILNAESHMEEQAKSMTGFVERYSPEVKQRLAKSIITLLYYLNEKHVSSYLHTRDGHKMRVLQEWLDSGFDVLRSN